jgi:hypothetical protein
MDYNKKLLHEDVKFPLKWDSEEYKMYIFDSDNNMIAQVDLDTFEDPAVIQHPFTKLLGDYKEVEGDGIVYELAQGDYINKLTMEVIGCVRGWGRLQQLKSPKGEKRQDNIAAYILNVINN